MNLQGCCTGDQGHKYTIAESAGASTVHFVHRFSDIAVHALALQV